MQLNYAAATALEPGKTLRCHLVDGLQLRARKKERVWWYYYRHHGLQRYLRLGTFPTLGIDGAREAAKEHARTLAKGVDPAQARRDAMASPTLADVWDEYRREHIARKCKPNTAATYDVYWRAHLSRIGSTRVSDLTLNDVNRLLTRIGEEAPVSANRTRALLWAMMEYCEAPSVAYRPYGSNPCQRSITFKEYKRKRHIKRDEFAAIGDAMRAASVEHPKAVAAILCMLLAGTRVTELAKARHDELDTARGCIVLREHKTDRTGDDRVIWLPRQAFGLIRNLPVDNSGYLFGRDLDRYSLRRIWLRIVREAGCEDVRLQDLRRTFASVAKSRGASVDAVGELLGHKQRETTDHYAFLFEESAANLAQETGDAISGLLERKS